MVNKGTEIQDDWLRLIAKVIERPEEYLRSAVDKESFVQLGGTSLRAADLVACGERELGLSVNLAVLLSDIPLAQAIATASPCVELTVESRPDTGEALRPLLPGQKSILLSEELYGGTAYHLLFSLELRGSLSRKATVAAIRSLSERHEGLRTMFVRVDGEYQRRVLPASWHPPLLEQTVRLATGADLVSTVHSQLERVSSSHLNPLVAPPVKFFLTHNGSQENNALVTVLIHHALIDGFGIGLLWRDFIHSYEQACLNSDLTVTPAYSPDEVLKHHEALVRSGKLAEARRKRVKQLTGIRSVIELPSDLARPDVFVPSGARLVFGLSEEAVDSCERQANECGVTRNAVLLAAWSIVVARRTGLDDFLIGVPAVARRGRLAETLSLCSHLVPVRCTVSDDFEVKTFIRSISSRLVEAVAVADVPFEELVTELGEGGDTRRNPLVQVVFAPHDELIPASVRVNGLEFVVHEGHCGGSAFDATLFVQGWEDGPRLALEYATSVLSPEEAMDLADAFDATLVELGSDTVSHLASVRAISASQQRRLLELQDGTHVDAKRGLWQLFEERVVSQPDKPSVEALDATLTYAELLEAAIATSERLAEAGVTVGDTVLVSIPRSAAEIVAILATLRIGAAYVALDTSAPDARLKDMLDKVHPSACFAPPDVHARFELLMGRECPLVEATFEGDLTRKAGPAAVEDPDRVAYIAFTSGSTGVPKGVRIPHRAVARLVQQPDYVRSGPGERFLRLAPLPFDASTLELFAPLVGGSTICVYPDGPVSPTELSNFLKDQKISVLWLTAGLFRIVVDYGIEGFATVRQVLAGGDVVPAGHVRRLLTRFPGIRVTNGYGPTENTVFTTTYHADDVCDVEDLLPIGSPVPGTRALVLDKGGRPVPPGGVGELFAAGSGLAIDYLGLETETQTAFGFTDPLTGERLYRTGDLVRWDRIGRLRYLGRRDNQVKVRGYRVELDEVQRRLVEHPKVRDAVVVVAGDEASRRIVAGVVANEEPELVEHLRAFLAQSLPAYAVPSLWAIVETLPLTRNGKVDARQLEQLAQAEPSTAVVESETTASAAQQKIPVEPAEQRLEDVILSIWCEVLNKDHVGIEDRFFDVGGDSLLMATVHARLQSTLPTAAITMLDLFRFPTIRELADFLRGTPQPDQVSHILSHGSSGFARTRRGSIGTETRR